MDSSLLPSRFYVDETFHSNIDEGQRLANRIKYIESERQRRLKAAEQAKNKY